MTNTCSQHHNLNSSEYYHQVILTVCHSLIANHYILLAHQRLLEKYFPLLSINLLATTQPARQSLGFSTTTHSTLLLSSCQRLTKEWNPFTLTQQSPLGKETILALQLLESSYSLITYVHPYISYLITILNIHQLIMQLHHIMSHHHKINHKSLS